MMFYMTSKVFQNDFLTNESDADILKAQYVIVSTRIRVREKNKWKNIINCMNTLFPSPTVMSTLDVDDMRDRYKEEMRENNLALLASLVNLCVTKDFNIIFICTHSERKLHYLEFLADLIYEEFGYPVYEYRMYSYGISKIINYDKEKVKKRSEKFIRNAKKEYYKKIKDDKERNKAMMKDFKSMKKSELVKMLKKHNLYKKGMDKEDMLEMIELFFT